jgi:hypothetical protein
VARLNGRQWGLVLVVSSSPLVLAVLMGLLQPMMLRPVLGTPVGGLSWLLACVLGLVGGLFFARGLAKQQQDVPASPVRRSLGLVFAALPPIGLCIAPAVMLLLAGPAYATSLVYKETVSVRAVTSLNSAAMDFANQLRRSMPRQLPAFPSPTTPQW